MHFQFHLISKCHFFIIDFNNIIINLWTTGRTQRDCNCFLIADQWPCPQLEPSVLKGQIEFDPTLAPYWHTAVPAGTVPLHNALNRSTEINV